MSGVELTVAGWFAGAAISELANLVVLLIKKEIKYQKGVKGKLKTLAEDLTKIHATIHSAHKLRINNPALQDWLSKIKDAAKAAKNVLDLFSSNIIEERVEIISPVRPHKFKKPAGTFIKRLFFRYEFLNELHDVVKRFQKIAAERGDFLKLVELDLVARKHREMLGWQQTTSMPNESKMVGRDKEKNDTVNFLLAAAGNDENFAVISIVGVPGIGKTTLARAVYNDKNVREHFDIKVWICVSDEFNVKRLMIEIIESASSQRPHDLHSLINLNTIQEILKQVLMEKRFLIVIDDVKSDQIIAMWETLCPYFEFGKKGSRIIMTTCDRKIGNMIEMITINLKGIEGEDYWRLFKHWAFSGANPKDLQWLELKARQMVLKLGGSPLAAKMVGRMIASKLKQEPPKTLVQSKL